MPRGGGSGSRSMGSSSRSPAVRPPAHSRPSLPARSPQGKYTSPPAKSPAVQTKPDHPPQRGPSAAGTFGASMAGAAVGTMVGSALGSSMAGTGRGSVGAAGGEEGSALHGACANQFSALLDCANRSGGNLDECSAALDDLTTCHGMR